MGNTISVKIIEAWPHRTCVDTKFCECGCGQPTALARQTNTKLGHVKGEPVRFVAGHHARGKKFSVETRAKLSEARAKRVGDLAPFSGKTHSPETRAQMSASHIGLATGANHPSWKGENITYKAVHNWVARNKTKTGICSKCRANVGTSKQSGTHWANVDHQYGRNLTDYVEMCQACHRAHDEGMS